MAWLRNSAPRMSPRRVRRPATPGSAAAQVDRGALFAREREGDFGPRHREAPHHLTDRFRLGPVGLQELQPRRRGVEEVIDLDPRAVRERGPHDLGLLAALDIERPGMRLAGMPRGDGEPRHGADRGQRLAAGSKRADLQQVLVVELGGGVTLDRQ